MRRRHWAATWRGLALLLALCLAVYVPGQRAIPVVDRDEARFAQASRQMFEAAALPEADRDASLHAGGLVVPMVGERPRLNKPPLIYWLQSASAALWTGGDPARDAIRMYRVPSLLAAVGVVLVTWRIGLRMFDPRAALLGAALLAVSPVFAWEAHQARADMVMVLCTVVAQWGLYVVWRARERREARQRDSETASQGGKAEAGARERESERAREGAGARTEPVVHHVHPVHTGARLLRSWVWPVVLWAAVGLGVLTKGPVTPMVVALTALALCVLGREWRWLRATRPLLGVLVLGAVIAPWLVLVGTHESAGWDRLWSTWSDEVLGRSMAPKEGHWGPPGYHLLLLVVLFWPGVLLTGMAIERAWRRGVPGGWRAVFRQGGRGAGGTRGRSAEMFCLAWILPSWLVFEAVGTKLPHYTMPLYPAVALLTGRCVFAAASGVLPNAFNVCSRLGFVVWALIGAAMVCGAPLALVWGMWPDAARTSGAGLAVGACAMLALALVVLGLRESWRGRFARANMLGVCASAVAMLAIFAIAMPRADSVWATRELARAYAEVDPLRARPVALAVGVEDSVVFLFRGRAERISPENVGDWLETHPDGLVLTGADGLDGLPLREAARLGPALNYSRGEWVEYRLMEREPEQKDEG